MYHGIEIIHCVSDERYSWRRQEKVRGNKMDTNEKSKKELDGELKKRIELDIQYYKSMYPNEEFSIPEILVSFDFHQDAINIYKEFNYPNEYIEQLDEMTNWKTIVALTINNFNLSFPPKIIINALHWRKDTILHELTHVSDYCGYLRRHNYLTLNYIEFLKLEEYLSVYLFSEFRAFYREALFSNEDLGQRVEYETKHFSENQSRTIEEQNLDAYYYHSIKYVGFFCAYLEQSLSEDKINSFLVKEDSNVIHTLIKFLYPLRNKEFSELESYFNDFQSILDKMISES